MQFLSNAENAQKLNGLVDDIREAVVDYQVRTSKGSNLGTPNVCTDIFTAGYLRRHPSINRELLALTICSSTVIGK